MLKVWIGGSMAKETGLNFRRVIVGDGGCVSDRRERESSGTPRSDKGKSWYPVNRPALACGGVCADIRRDRAFVRLLDEKTVPLLFAVVLAVASSARAQQVVTTDPAPYNSLILQQIHTMPQAGGYSASHAATQRLVGAVSLDRTNGFNVEASQAEPSYCSGATYLVFLKTIDVLARRGLVSADDRTLASLLINGQRDGEGVWGRWNANGPGTARLFHELRLGENFSDFSQAQPGDFMKIFWSNAVGRREHGIR